MALQSSDIRPLELSKEALVLAKDSWRHVTMSAGVFLLLAGMIIVFTSGSSTSAALAGSLLTSFVMVLATLTAGLVTSTRALGIEIPLLASAMINERQYWRYIGGGIACMFIAGMLGFMAFMAGMSLVGQAPFVGISLASAGHAPAIIASLVVAALLTALMSIRLFLVLPAVVVGEKVSISRSWSRTRGIAIKLALAAGVSLGGIFALQILVKYVGAIMLGAEGLPMIEATNAVLRVARGAVEGSLAGVVMAKILDREAVSQSS